jgi:two-component system, cell cycle response regulator DivK
MARILVVEDDPDICHLVAVLLQGAGHSIMTAADGARAIALARQDLPDLIVMDLVLPITDGWTAIGRLKREARTAHIPILALSAHAQTDDRMRARAAGCDDFLIKPFEVERLLAQVAAFTDRDHAVGRSVI